MTGPISVESDPKQGLIRVHGAGLWTPQIIDRHFQELERALIQMRRLRGRVAVIVDLREAMVQTAEAAQALGDWTARIYKPQDRVAVLCATALVAMQVRRAAKVEQLRTFTTPAEGLAWLGIGLGPESPASAS